MIPSQDMAKHSQAEARQQAIEIQELAAPASRLPSALRFWRGWRRQVVIPYLFLLPFLLLFSFFLLVPLLYALWTSFFVERLIGGMTFVGWQNYQEVLRDGNFWEGVRNVLLLLFTQVPLMLGLSLLLALLLDSQIVRLKTIFRLGYFLPYAIPSVIGALLWGYLYSAHIGPFAQLAELLHWPPPPFLSAAGLLPSIANILTWQWTGYNMVILYAALQAIPPELYDAARVDGASGWEIARRIKIPLIAPALVLTVVFSIIGTLQLFNEPQIMTAIVPNLIQDHYTPNLYAYNLAFTNQQYNYAAAVSFVLGAVVFVFSYVFMLVTYRRGQR
ncbi:carbohydrate ABC transporter permease [Thermogemmatispora onikobensis]|uniref:carbohydrate ABC transporter permease n=1 Tax=Thermogemmatispora onikobensis TaxID=732234 RepID=UPI000AC4B797|nr:sugar ABC transporter permease [Thermogemmatispora onikobensis]